jgi:hypothetical protein
MEKGILPATGKSMKQYCPPAKETWGNYSVILYIFI